MAKNVTIQVIGAEPKVVNDVCNVLDCKKRVGLESYTATVNGNPSNDRDPVSDYAYVGLSAPVKGGR